MTDERISRPRANHMHIDVNDEDEAMLIIESIDSTLGPIAWKIEEYRTSWWCKQCGQSRKL